jgi:peptidoglycan/LPS O-acetylase OafA/YrhL
VDLIMEAARDTTAETTNHVDGLSVLRLFAWLLVFETHVLINGGQRILAPAFPQRGQIWPLLTPAWAGVWIFFILSGYLMGKAFLAGRYDLSASGLKAFYFNRLVRIAPLYFFALLVVAVFVNPEVFKLSNLHVLVPLLTFTYNGQQPINIIGALWYVSTLMQLYFVTPLFFFIVRRWFANRRFAAVALVALIAVGVLIRLVPVLVWHDANPVTHWYEWVYSPMWSNLDLFFGGFLLASLTRGRKHRPIPVVRGLSVATLLALSVATSYIYDKGMNMGTAPLGFLFVYVIPSVWLVAIAFFVLSFDTGPRTERLSRSAIHRNPLRALEVPALLTFGLYVWHEPVLSHIASITSGLTPWFAFGVTWALGLLISATLATVTYLAIERPSSRWKLLLVRTPRSNRTVV